MIITSLQRQFGLALAFLLIIGGIMYLESQKVSPGVGGDGNSDIAIEDLLLGTSTVAIEGERESPEEKKSNPMRGFFNFLTGDEEKIREATQKRITSKTLEYEVAKEISTPDGFINTEGLKISDLIGEKIILIDFWTYSCINCQRTIPHLVSLYDKYTDDGLVIIGLHTPEFEFEKEYDNVLRATRNFKIEYPVVLDNDFSTWRAYENRYWPRKYLIDIDGFIVYDHIGEGAYDETEEKIVELLNERKRILNEKGNVALDERSPQNVEEVNFALVGTPETYLGSSRVEYIGNLPSLDCFGIPCEFSAAAAADIARNTYHLNGEWQINDEESILVGDEGSITIRFFASKVKLVAGSSEGARAEIFLDGRLVTDKEGGVDVVNGIVNFEASDLYNLIDLKGDYGEHVLEIRFLEPGVSAFAFTFG